MINEINTRVFKYIHTLLAWYRAAHQGSKCHKLHHNLAASVPANLAGKFYSTQYTILNMCDIQIILIALEKTHPMSNAKRPLFFKALTKENIGFLAFDIQYVDEKHSILYYILHSQTT
jgi:hypothetical protein